MTLLLTAAWAILQARLQYGYADGRTCTSARLGRQAVLCSTRMGTAMPMAVVTSIEQQDGRRYGPFCQNTMSGDRTQRCYGFCLIKFSAGLLSNVDPFDAHQVLRVVAVTADEVMLIDGCMQGNMPQALDVLKTGMAHQKGAGRDRLQLLTAELYANDSNWVGTLDEAAKV